MFISTGFDDLESMIFSMKTSKPITHYTLMEEINIKDESARKKIINSLSQGKLFKIESFNFICFKRSLQI